MSVKKINIRHELLKWQKLGHDDGMWKLLRFYLLYIKNNAKFKNNWKKNLEDNYTATLPDGSNILIEKKDVISLIEYLKLRDIVWKYACNRLHNRDDSRIIYKESKNFTEAIGKMAEDVRDRLQPSLNINTRPNKRCVWSDKNNYHISARELDGAIPDITNPKVIWEIKEYWGKNAGSKMSASVYECTLVGKELREWQKTSNQHVLHYVFLDGKEQWSVRKADFHRIIDLHAQGLIDKLYIGKDVEKYWIKDLNKLLPTIPI